MGFGGTGAGFDDQSIATAAVDAAVAQISASTEAMLVLSSTGGTLTADGTEQTLYIDNEPLGCFKPLVLHIDLDAMGAADTIVVRTYYRIADAGGLQQQDFNQYAGADGGLASGSKIATIDLEPCRHGFSVTLQQTAIGAYQDYPWELLLEV